MSAQRAMHGNYRFHPIVGAGKAVKPRKTGRATCSKFEAWMWLNGEQWTVQEIPGDGGNHITLDVGMYIEHMPDVSIEWNWPPLIAKQYISDLEKAKLITPGLGFLISQRIARSRKKRRGAIGPPTREAVFEKTSGRCVYCGIRLVLEGGRPNSFQPDHVLPVKLDGGDDVANLVPSCAACNALKKAKTALQFLGSAA